MPIRTNERGGRKKKPLKFAHSNCAVGSRIVMFEPHGEDMRGTASATALEIAEVHVEERIARLESDVAHIRSDVAEMKQDIRDLRKDLYTSVDALKGSIAELRNETQGSIAGLRSETQRLFAELRAEMHKGFAELRVARVFDRVWYLLMCAALLGVMARGFKWI